MWASYVLLTTLFFSGLSEQYKRPDDRSRSDCFPVRTDAPFGLPDWQYNTVYHRAQEATEGLLNRGCSESFLLKLTSCDLKSEKDIRSLIRATSGKCQGHISRTIGQAKTHLLTYGCLDENQFHDALTPSEILHRIYASARELSPQTACLALIKSSRLAMAMSLKKSPDDPATSPTMDSPPLVITRRGSNLWVALVAGALAGLAVDLSLYPLDTIKTRLQSAGGFRAAGGFTHLYQGIGSIALGSAPSSALFFLAYELAGLKLTQKMGQTFAGHLVATTIGELVSSFVRVPADVVKSRLQVDRASSSDHAASLSAAVKKIYKESSRVNMRPRIAVFYTGWLSSLLREIPFGCIQFPLFEYLKGVFISQDQGTQGSSLFTVALCGMIAGSVAGSLTTPLDVLKTRIMLAERGESSILAVLKNILRNDGVQGLFRGILPRTMWISLGGAIFLGGYSAFVAVMAPWNG